GFIIKSNDVSSAVINKLLDFVLQSAVFIENNLDYSPNRGTELLISYLGLLAAGLLFDKTSYGQKIFSMGKAGFEQESRRLIYISGVYKGQSVLRSTLVLETLLYADLFVKKRNQKFSSGYSSILENMFLVFLEYLREDKSIPAFGDDYIIRILPFNYAHRKREFTYMAALGVYYLNIETLKYYAPKPTAEILFLFGTEALKKYDSINALKHEKKSISIEPGGIYFLRNKDLDIFIKCGEIGFGAPSHNDTLSFDVFYKNKLFITDSGTYSIYKDEKTRNEFRSVKAHNTAYIDGTDLAEFDGIFGLKEDLTKPKIIEWNTLGEEDILTVQHYAYTGSSDPAICKRSFILNKEKNSLKIKDEFFGGKKHQVNLNLHFHPDVQISDTGKNEYKLAAGDHLAEVLITSPSDILKSAVAEYDYSETYGSIEKAKAINILLQDQFPSFFVTEFKFV
ncbi:MAG: heparinase II/III-family protein, partial [Bacteroidota bacterium]|nr:heparinase II/III-family protein [Bacteroidota bacterium]